MNPKTISEQQKSCGWLEMSLKIAKAQSTRACGHQDNHGMVLAILLQKFRWLLSVQHLLPPWCSHRSHDAIVVATIASVRLCNHHVGSKEYNGVEDLGEHFGQQTVTAQHRVCRPQACLLLRGPRGGRQMSGDCSLPLYIVDMPTRSDMM